MPLTWWCVENVVDGTREGSNVVASRVVVWFKRMADVRRLIRSEVRRERIWASVPGS